MSSEIPWAEAIKLVVKAAYGPTAAMLTREEEDLIERDKRGQIQSEARQPGLWHKKSPFLLEIQTKISLAYDRLRWKTDQEAKSETWLMLMGFSPPRVNHAELKAELCKAYPSSSVEFDAPHRAGVKPISSSTKSKVGAKPMLNWDEVEEYVRKMLDERGDPKDRNQELDWRTQADVIRAVEEYLDKRKEPRPAPNTMKAHIAPMIKNWRERTARN